MRPVLQPVAAPADPTVVAATASVAVAASAQPDARAAADALDAGRQQCTRAADAGLWRHQRQECNEFALSFYGCADEGLVMGGNR